jgi:hypothetical protein
MQRLKVSGAVRPLYGSLGVKGLSIQHAMRMRHTVMWPAQLYNIFPYYLINGTILDIKAIEHKMYVLISSANSV